MHIRVKNSPEFIDDVTRYSSDLFKNLAARVSHRRYDVDERKYSGDPCQAGFVQELFKEDQDRFEVRLEDGGHLPLLGVAVSDGMGKVRCIVTPSTDSCFA